VQQWQYRKAIKTLKSGGVIAYPSESVFGLGCDPYNLQAVSDLLSIKQRSYKKGLIILVSDIEQAASLIAPLSTQQKQRIQTHTGRATTWLVDKSQRTSPLLAGTHHKLAVRVTTNQVAKKLCEMMQGPIVSTSCNRNAKPTSRSAAVIRNKFYLPLAQIIPGACGGEPASRIVDLESGQILRA
jgi:L-threonylcarbamoyladenylate synthase